MLSCCFVDGFICCETAGGIWVEFGQTPYFLGGLFGDKERSSVTICVLVPLPKIGISPIVRIGYKEVWK